MFSSFVHWRLRLSLVRGRALTLGWRKFSKATRYIKPNTNIGTLECIFKPNVVLGPFRGAWIKNEQFTPCGCVFSSNVTYYTLETDELRVVCISHVQAEQITRTLN